jgi:hypothetical protein
LANVIFEMVYSLFAPTIHAFDTALIPSKHEVVFIDLSRIKTRTIYQILVHNNQIPDETLQILDG